MSREIAMKRVTSTFRALIKAERAHQDALRGYLEACGWKWNENNPLGVWAWEKDFGSSHIHGMTTSEAFAHEGWAQQMEAPVEGRI